MVDPRLKRTGSIRDELSPRERQLLECASRGLTDQAIANRLGISLATVGTYWGRVRIKLGPLNRTELVAKYLKEEASATVALLRNENRDLLRQIENHAQSMQMLRASMELFRELVETAPDAILLVSHSGTIELANEQADEMFGYHRGELLGLEIEKLIPARYHSQHRTNRGAYMENPVRRKMGEHASTPALKRDGTEFPVAAALSAIETPGGFLITCIVRDLSGSQLAW